MSKKTYERFHIDAKAADNAFSVPNKFDVRARRLRLAAMLVHEAIHYRLNREVVLSRPCIYGVFSGRFGGFKPIKQRCVGCMRCVQEYPHIMRVDYSAKYRELGDSHWTPESVFTILYESSTGKIPVKGMGYKGRFGGEGWDGIWTDMSEIVRPTRDGVFGREYISTSVDIGSRPFVLDFSSNNSEIARNVRTFQSSLPVMLQPPDGSNLSVDIAVKQAAAKLGVYHLSTNSRDVDEGDKWNVPIVKSDDLGKVSLDRTRMLEVEATDLKQDLVNRLRQYDPPKIVSARLRIDESAEDEACRLVRDRADVIHLYADYHGFDYSKDHNHISDGLRRIHTRLVTEGIRDSVTLIASGGITLAEHVPKAIICGADLVGIDTTLLVALQAVFKGETRDRMDCKLAPRIVDPSWGTQRLINLMASWHDQLIEILSAMGMRDVRRLRGDVGRSMTDVELREQAFEGIRKLA
jgi:Conserved region in glutamate synthase